MATPRLYKYYPQEYTDLFLNAIKQAVVVPCHDEAGAKALRGQLYAFRSSLAAKDCGAPADLILIAPLIAFRVVGSSLIVHRPNRVFTLAKALDHVRSSAETSPATAIPASVRQHDADDT